MPPAVYVRLATPDDASSITAVLRAAFAPFEADYTPEAMAATVVAPTEVRARMAEGPVWVALAGDAVVGTVAVLPRGSDLYVRGMAVAPEAQAAGVGGRLLAQAEAYARERGFTRLTLCTTPYLARAIRLYERRGFRRVAEGPADLFGTPLFTMAKPLRSAGA